MEAALSSACPMRIHVKFMGDLPALLGTRRLELALKPGATVSDLLDALTERYGDDFRNRVYCSPGVLRQAMVIFVAGVNINVRGGLSSPLTEADGEVEVVRLPVIVGG